MEKIKESKISKLLSKIGVINFISFLVISIILLFYNLEYAILSLMIGSIFISGIIMIISNIFSRMDKYTEELLTHTKSRLNGEFDINKLYELRKMIYDYVVSNNRIKLNRPTEWNRILLIINERIFTIESTTKKIKQ